METKKGADSLEHWLCSNGFPATTIHGDRTQQVSWIYCWTIFSSVDDGKLYFCSCFLLCIFNPVEDFFSFSAGNNYLQLLACFHYSVLFSWTPFLLHFSSSPCPSINFVPIVDVNIWATVLWEPSNNDWLLKYLILETDLIPRKLASWQCQGAVLHVHYFITTNDWCYDDNDGDRGYMIPFKQKGATMIALHVSPSRQRIKVSGLIHSSADHSHSVSKIWQMFSQVDNAPNKSKLAQPPELSTVTL